MKRAIAILSAVLLLLVVVVRATHSFADEPNPTAPLAAREAKSAAAAPPSAKAEKPKFTTRSLRGKVVFLAEAMKRLHGVESDADAAEQTVALETPDAKLYGIVKDFRGRGFLIDPRLRGIDMELLVRQYEGSPLVQIVRVYTLKKGQKYELDYWCDICAIPMYELKACECCQGPTRIREQPVEPDSAPKVQGPSQK